MKKYPTSRETILASGRKIIAREGIDGLNIRALAAENGVSVGTIYNYFSSKEDLIVQTFISIWQDILDNPEATLSGKPFDRSVQYLFDSFQRGCRLYPGFARAHALSMTGRRKFKAKDAMLAYFGRIQDGLNLALLQDARVREEVFTDQFTPRAFVDFVFFNLIALISRDIPSCDFLLETVNRVIY